MAVDLGQSLLGAIFCCLVGLSGGWVAGWLAGGWLVGDAICLMRLVVIMTLPMVLGPIWAFHGTHHKVPEALLSTYMVQPRSPQKGEAQLMRPRNAAVRQVHVDMFELSFHGLHCAMHDFQILPGSVQSIRCILRFW